ncbi:MAG: SDR family oxidoreductase [Gammaproteobacteria bacterium]|nr:SDR family oxidoreductase [Gammaproteobacteria bacterium]
MKSRTSILITGASGGIGRAAAIECAERGARVAVHYNGSRERAEQTLSALAGDGHQLFQCDITDPAAVEQLIEDADSALEGLDVLVNNAGISQRLRFDEIDYATWQKTWRRIVDTNLTAASNLCFCAGQKMIQHGGGRIVNVSSRGAFRGEPLMPWYGASKAGMNAMGQSLAQALGPKAVYVYTVAPGFVETEMAAAVLATPEGDSIRNQSSIGRVAKPEELGKTIGFLAFEAPAFMTGCIVDVNGASYLRS